MLDGREDDQGPVTCFLSVDSSEFADPSSGVRLTHHGRVATISFPEEEKHKCPGPHCRVRHRVEGDKSRAVGNVGIFEPSVVR